MKTKTIHERYLESWEERCDDRGVDPPAWVIEGLWKMRRESRTKRFVGGSLANLLAAAMLLVPVIAIAQLIEWFTQ